MADAVVSAAVNTIIRTLTSTVVEETSLQWGLKDEIKSLESTFTTLQLYLEDAEIKQWNNKPMQNWLRNLKDAVYDAEDVLDEMALENHRREDAAARSGNSFICLRNPKLLFRPKMAHKVKKVRERLSAIAGERVLFNLEQGVAGNLRFGTTFESRETTSLVTESEVLGRIDEKEMITEKLLDNAWAEYDLSIYAICGMGGLGKTTLAQLVYNDQRIKNHFELRIWVCVADDFNIQRLVKAMIKSIDANASTISGLDELETLQHQFREMLKGRRFLLILDDVWNEEERPWDQLKEILRCESKGSVMVVTTRNEKIASMMENIGVHHIGYLMEGDSWALFEQKASSTGKVDDSLVAIGKAIVKKCCGVPLAIKAIGSLMRSKCGESEWLAIQESEMLKLSSEGNGILPILRLSYDNLLPHMRQCFAYCSLFPKDYEMKVIELVQLWMANGFVPRDNGQGDLFFAGCLIFKELAWRSVFQDIKINYLGERTCKMHDLIHDVAISVMENETYILENNKLEKIPKVPRHISLLKAESNIERELKFTTHGSLRTLIYLGNEIYHGKEIKYDKKVISSFLSKQQNLRALKMTQNWTKSLPSLIFKLEHLKYLCMSCPTIESLPESLTRLYNLQTLKLMKSQDLLELHNDLRRMKNLWFLEMDSFRSLRCTPPELGELTCLQRLSIFIVGEGASQQIDQLKELNLGGELTISGLENVKNLEEAESANLRAKKNLTRLNLSWSIDDHRDKSPEYFEEVLQGLEPPHQNLEIISIHKYQGSKFPNWMSTFATFKRLEEIKLQSCAKCEHLPILGKLPSLRRLRLVYMDSVRCLGVEWHGDAECSFSVLTELVIDCLSNLEEWSIPDLVRSFPCLSDLRIYWCPKLDKLPFLANLNKLHIHNCNEVLVSYAVRLTTLEELAIKYVDFRSLPNTLASLSSLKVLTLVSCNALASFSASLLDDLPSLRTLRFLDCGKLKPFMGPMICETALQHLVIEGLPEFEYFPQSMQQFNSLSTLEINNCGNLKSFPNWFTSLKSLRELHVFVCPQLEGRCKKLNGEDWPQISHIPLIKINNKTIQNLDRND